MQYIMSNKFLVVLNDKNEALAFEIIKDKNGKTWLDPEGVNIDKDGAGCCNV